MDYSRWHQWGSHWRSRFCLLIVDSATALYRSDYVGRGELAARQAHLSKFLRTLQRLADEVRKTFQGHKSHPLILRSSLALPLYFRIKLCQVRMLALGHTHPTRRSQLEEISWRMPLPHGTLSSFRDLRRQYPLCLLSLQLKKGRANTRICRIYDSPCLPESETTFAILQSGIGDPEEEV